MYRNLSFQIYQKEESSYFFNFIQLHQQTFYPYGVKTEDHSNCIKSYKTEDSPKLGGEIIYITYIIITGHCRQVFSKKIINKFNCIGFEPAKSVAVHY